MPQGNHSDTATLEANKEELRQGTDEYVPADDFDALFLAMDKAEGTGYYASQEDSPTNEQDDLDASEQAEGNAGEQEDAEDASENADTTSEAGDEQEDAEDAGAPVLELNELADLLPGAVIETKEQAVETVRQLTEMLGIYGQLDELSEQHPEYAAFVGGLLKGMAPREAAIEAIEGLASQVPDPDEDPEAYADYKARQREKQVRGEYAEKELAEQGKVQQRAEGQAEKHYGTFATRMKKADPDFDEKVFAKTWLTLVRGDQRGNFRSDAFDIVWKGLHHERLVQEAVEAARTDGKNEGISETKNKKKRRDKQPAAPSLNGRRRQIEESPDVKEMRHFAAGVLGTTPWYKDPNIVGEKQASRFR